jgi:carbamoyltransferase
VVKNFHLGVGGLVGLDPNPFKHIKKYSLQHSGVGVALGDIGHDAAAVVVERGRPIFAVEEERLNRLKHFMGVPRLAAQACAHFAGVGMDAMSTALYLEPDEAHLERRVAACSRFVGPRVVEAMCKEYAHVQRLTSAHAEAWPGLRHVDHHLAHAASAFYPSGFDRSLVLVVDGQGECASTTLMLGDDQGLTPIAEYGISSSLGIMYAAVTAFLGFEPIEDEYKIMGLAAYGTSDDHKDFFDQLIVYQDDGGFVIPSLLAPPKARLFEWTAMLGRPRLADQPIEPRHVAIAYSLQKATERAVLRLLETAERKHKTRHLCLAGGVALNCSLNGMIDRSGLFDRIFVQPAANDPGAALGAALVSYHQANPKAPRERGGMPYLGPSFDSAAVTRVLESFGDKIQWSRPADYTAEVARLIAKGDVIGWFQGRMEFGPFDPRRSTASGDDGSRQSGGQEAGGVPALRAVGHRRGGRQLLRAPPPRSVPAHDGRREGQTGTCLGDPGGGPRERHRAGADRPQGGERCLPRADHRGRQADRSPGRPQHLVQRQGRADRLYAGGCGPLLSRHRDRSPRDRRPPGPQARQGLSIAAQRRTLAGP